MENDTEEARVTKKRKTPATENLSTEEDTVGWMDSEPKEKVLIESLLKQHQVTLGLNKSIEQ